MATSLENQLVEAQEILEALMSVLKGRASQVHNSYSIGDRSISKMSLNEVRVEYSFWKNEVNRLKRETRLSEGGVVSVRIRG